MQLTIDLDKLSTKDLSVNEYLTLLSVYYKTKAITIPYTDRKMDYFSLQEKKYLVISGNSVSLTPKALSLMGIFGRDYVSLAMDIRSIFPKGSKAGKYPWKSTVKSLTDKLKKLDKSFGMSEYTDEQILAVVNQYVGRFTSTDMDRGMQIASYFVEKDGESALMAWLQMEPEKEFKSTEIKL